MPPTGQAERCRYVADLIEAHPENFDMNHLATSIANDDRSSDIEIQVEYGARPDLAECGAVGCIAGWTLSVTPPSECNDAAMWEHIAGPLLGLDPDDAVDLFFDFGLAAPDAAFLLRWHADELDRA